MASQKKKENEFSYKSYQESDAVKEARKRQEEVLANKPADYQSAISGDIKNSMNQYLNREKFSYDMNADPTYNQYKNAFVQQGKMAMMDTMGQAAALTGGYGSSYASIAGNQAYQQNLQQLNNIIPELEQNAYSRYQQEGQDILNRYSLLSEQENLEYSRYRDSMADWNAERSLAESQYNAERDYDYNKYQSDKAFDYGAYRDAVADKQYKEQFDYNKYRDTVADEQYKEQFEYGKDRDKVADAQWDKNYQINREQADIAKEQWDIEKSEYEKSKAEYEASKSEGGTTSALQHVSAMSSEELVSTMQAYQMDGDDIGLEAFLDDCIASGRLTEAQAVEYYDKFKTKTSTTPTSNKVPQPQSSFGPAIGFNGFKIH